MAAGSSALGKRKADEDILLSRKGEAAQRGKGSERKRKKYGPDDYREMVKIFEQGRPHLHERYEVNRNNVPVETMLHFYKEWSSLKDKSADAFADFKLQRHQQHRLNADDCQALIDIFKQGKPPEHKAYTVNKHILSESVVNWNYDLWKSLEDKSAAAFENMRNRRLTKVSRQRSDA